MREIKFRGKRVDSGKWVHGHYFQSPLTEENALDNDVEDGLFFLSGETQHCIESDHVVFIVDPETIGEYTGRHDKNGTEIYEGDILDIEIDKPVEVFYWEASFLVRGGWLSGDDLGNYSERAEIIGNIHEPPKHTEAP